MKWEVGQTVDVQSRTWAGINKPGGCAKITKVHYTADGANIESLDVKYVLGGGHEKQIDPAIVSPFETLERRGRKRQERDFLMKPAVTGIAKRVQENIQNKKSQAKRRQPPPTQPQNNNKSTKSPADSTSPSTPVTPEHPSTKKNKKESPTVPSYVIADNKVEVSPLPVDRSCLEPKQTSVPRRGLLFGSSGSNAVQDKKTFVPIVPSRQTERAETKVTTQRWFGAASEPSNPGPILRRMNNVTNVIRDRPQAPAEDHKLPAKPSLELAGTATKQAKDPIRGTQRRMKEIFDIEVQKAKDFMEEVCGARDEDIIADDENSMNKKRMNTSFAEEDTKPASNPRREEFKSIFRKLRLKFDDGCIDESEFRRLINQDSCKPFSEAEVTDQIEWLCSDGKVMKSEGMLYIID